MDADRTSLARWSESRLEKPVRASLLSTVTRSLSKRRILICDGLNYIKGTFKREGASSLVPPLSLNGIGSLARPTDRRTLTVPVSTLIHVSLRLPVSDELRSQGGRRPGLHRQYPPPETAI